VLQQRIHLGGDELTVDEKNLIQELYKRYNDALLSIWNDYQVGTYAKSGPFGRFYLNLVNVYNNQQTMQEMLLLYSLKQGKYETAIPSGQIGLVALDAATRQSVLNGLLKLTGSLAGKFLSEGVKGTVIDVALPKGIHGQTTELGQMRISTSLTAAERAEAVAHEARHSFLSPMAGTMGRELRATIASNLYRSSQFLRYSEEAYCQVGAQVTTRSLTGLTLRQAVWEGLKHPIVETGYKLTLKGVLTEGLVLPVGAYGIEKGADLLSEELLLDE